MKNSIIQSQELVSVQLPLPDCRKTVFIEECHRQSLLLRDDPHEAEILDWLDSVVEREGWEYLYLTWDFFMDMLELQQA